MLEKYQQYVSTDQLIINYNNSIIPGQCAVAYTRETLKIYCLPFFITV